MDSERKEFEAWFGATPSMPLFRAGDGYKLMSVQQQWCAWQARAEQSRAECEALRKDAERYRKLRSAFHLRVFAVDREGYPGTCLIGQELDAALDGKA